MDDRTIRMNRICPYCRKKLNIIYDKDIPEDSYIEKQEDEEKEV